MLHSSKFIKKVNCEVARWLGFNLLGAFTVAKREICNSANVSARVEMRVTVSMTQTRQYTIHHQR